MNIDNQTAYWDRVADQKTFSHPVNQNLLKKYISTASLIIDFGCGYGRLVNEMMKAGYKNITGYDTSAKLVERGLEHDLPLKYIDVPDSLPIEDNSVDCILLFAVLTCIPSNAGQRHLISLLQSKLKPGGIIYISDYYLQNNEASKSRYEYYDDDPENFGVFKLPEGAIFRHHTQDWIQSLLASLEIREQDMVDVKTMNGNHAEAFQVIAAKQS